MRTRSFSVAKQLSTLFGALLLCAAVCIPAKAFAQGKIAVINLRRAVLETEDGLRVQSKLKQLFDSRQTELESQEKAYSEARVQFDKLQKRKAAKKELQRRFDALQKQAAELQNNLVSYRRELQRQESEMMFPIVQRLLRLIRQLASKSGYDMVLNKEAVPFYRSDLDVTDRVIQMYNTTSSTAPKKKPAPKNKPPPAKKVR